MNDNQSVGFVITDCDAFVYKFLVYQSRAGGSSLSSDQFFFWVIFSYRYDQLLFIALKDYTKCFVVKEMNLFIFWNCKKKLLE